ncbi:MAG: hypothetical protein GXP54_08575, partial [Deltaproteobacteria bacterium]|nr:hypothetical protein [Deltaproteobacteria bacterium]
CKDDDYLVNPGQTETCNLKDDNCNNLTDEDPDGGLCGSIPQASAHCVGGQCELLACDDTFYDVNQVFDDGCECQWDSTDADHNSCATAVDLGNFSDAVPGSYTQIAGRIVPDTDVDWYKFTATDTADSGSKDWPGHDGFHVKVEVTLGDEIKVNLYRGSCSAAVECNGGNALAGLYEWYTDQVDAANNLGEGTCFTEPGPRLWDCCRPDECEVGDTTSDDCCGGSANDNLTVCSDYARDIRYCNDDSNTYYIRVVRGSGAADSCQATEYTIDISNGG